VGQRCSSCLTTDTSDPVMACDVRWGGAVVQCDYCGKGMETACGEVQGDNFGPVLNPDGSPSDITLVMLTGQGR
jgi:hypothetical protein